MYIDVYDAIRMYMSCMYDIYIYTMYIYIYNTYIYIFIHISDIYNIYNIYIYTCV